MKRLSFLGIVLVVLIRDVQPYKRVCYFTNWAQYRTAPMTFTAENVDPFLCTHIMYAFGKVVGNTIDAYEWNDKGAGGQYERIMNLRMLNPNLKILLAIGGWTHGTAPFTAVVVDPNNIAAFAANTLEYLKTYKFDGLDLDWEYPGGNGSPPEDKQRFTSLVQKLRQVFNDEGAVNNRPPMLLTAAVAAGKSTIDNAYEVDLISKDLDFINLMSYDLHGSWEATTGHHSALFGRSGEVGTAASMNVDYSVNYWISLGAPPHKLVLGLGLYGRSFTLFSSSNTLVGAPAAGAGIAGPYTGEAGLLAFYEVCYNLKFNGWTREWHSEHQVPYAYSGNQWICYDDAESFNVKIDYIIAKGLGGGMVWSLDQDDFSNSCGDGSYPLMNVLRTRLSTIPPTSIQSITTQPTSTTVPHSTTTRQSDVSHTSILPSTNSQLITTQTTKHTTASNILTSSRTISCGAPQPCVDGQLYGDSCDPKIYYQCASGVAYQFQCAAGTVWDERIKNCNWDYLVLTSPTPCGCGPPPVCTDGQFYADKCDMKVYYQCAHGIPYPYECNTGTVWDTAINNCNWDYAVPNRAPPTGSDCTSLGPITTGTTLKNTEQTTLAPAKLTTNINLSTVGPLLTPFPTTLDQTTQFQSTLLPKADLITSSVSCGAPKTCVDGQLYGDSCDPKIYYQCASGVAYQFQCAAGTVWDERIKNCNWDYLVLTSPTPCGCGPPSTCTDGQFYADKCDMKVYYQCAHGIPYPYECNTGTVWDTVISNCNWDYAVPNRAPPTGSDCTSLGPITTGTTLKNTEQTTLAPAKLTTNINLSTVGPLLTPFPTTLDQTTQFQSTLLPKADLITSSVSCGAPKTCVDGQLYGDSCDPKIYYQCASGVAYQFQCAAGTVWDERIKNCNWDYLVLTSPTPCGCGPPSTCIDGQFYTDKCDMKVYYQCAHGIPYPYECNTGTVWDTVISNCNWDYAVPNRAPPTGSGCTSQGPITTGTTPQNTEHMTSVAAKMTSVGGSLTPFSTTVDQTNSYFLSTLFPKTDLFTTTAKTLSFVETSPPNLITTYSSTLISSIGSLKTDQHTTPTSLTTTTQQQVTTLLHTATSDSTPSQAQQHVTPQSTNTTTNGLSSQTLQQLATKTSIPSTDNTHSQIQQQTTTKSRIAVTDSTQAQSSQQTQTLSPIAASDSTRQQTTQFHSTYSNTKDTTSTSHITHTGNPFSKTDAQTTTQPSGITNSVWSSQIPQQTTTNAPSTSDPTPIKTTTSPSTSDPTPIKTTTSPSTSDTTPIKTTTSPSTSDPTPIKTTTSPSTSDTTPIKTTTSPSTSDTTPIKTTTSPSTSDPTPIKTTTSPSTSDPTPIKTTTSPSTSDPTPIKTTSSPSTSDPTPQQTTTESQTTTCGPPKTCPFPAWDSGSMTVSAHTLTVLTGVLVALVWFSTCSE